MLWSHAFRLNADGTKGNIIGSGQTDGQGNFSIPMGDYSGPVLCQMTGGNYVDEATGINMPVLQNDVMTCVIPSMSAGSTVSGIHMTPLTSMAQMMAQNMPGSMTSLNITVANNAVGQHFNIDDILHTPPMNTAVNGAGFGANQYMKNYGMTIAAMSKYANMIGMTGSSGIVTAMMNDASDGYMNGMMGTSGIMMGGGPAMMTVIHLISNVLVFIGFVIMWKGWKLIHSAKGLVTGGPYAYVRHPQYSGLLLIMIGMLIQWPTIITALMFPVLIYVYYRLSKREEGEMIRVFGEEYRQYMDKKPMFIPVIRGSVL